MMTQEDKQFIREALDDLKDELIAKIKDNATAIQENGVLMEEIQSQLKGLSEGQKTHTQQLSNMQTLLEQHQIVFDDYPQLRATVQKHSRQLAALKK